MNNIRELIRTLGFMYWIVATHYDLPFGDLYLVASSASEMVELMGVNLKSRGDLDEDERMAQKIAEQIYELQAFQKELPSSEFGGDLRVPDVQPPGADL